MKIKKFFLLASVSIFLFSCNSVNKKNVKETVENFFTAYQSSDFSEATSIYPKVSSLKGNFRKSSKIDIDEKDIWVINENKIIVNLTHHWINPLGVDNSSKMRFYLSKEGDKYKIIDSKNFCVYDGLDLYKYAVNQGNINLSKDTTDVLLAKKLEDAQSDFNLAKLIVKRDIIGGLEVSWNWETGYYANYASGRGVVKNNSPYPIKSPKYHVTYYKNDGETVITSDDGYVCYDILRPGQSKSFSWFTSYAGKASQTGVTVDCDEEWISEIVANL